MKQFTLLLLIIVSVSRLADATIRHVPNDYATIQAALDVVVNGDTVLVAPGIYVEALYTPPRQFVLRGEATIDSNGANRTIVDPTDLPNSPTLRCVTMSGGVVEFRDIVFRNRSGMTEGRSGAETAGVRGDTTVQSVVFRNCVFDSVLGAIKDISNLTIDNCLFVGSISTCLSTPVTGMVYADSTRFDGTSSTNLLHIRSGGLFDHCAITGHGPGRLLIGIGDSLVLQNCRFGSTTALSDEALWVRPKCSSEITHCVFDGIHAQVGVVLIQDSCFEQIKGWDCSIRLIGNRFVRCGAATAPPVTAGPVLRLTCNNLNDRGYLAFLDSNIVEETQRISSDVYGFKLQASCDIKNSVITSAMSTNAAQMLVQCGPGVDTLTLQFNSLTSLNPGVLRVPDEPSLVDARDNWWGHPSGPYNEGANPGGLGARVGDEIAFIPWLTANPDTTHNDTSEIAIDLPPSIAETYSLRAYPNPFNAVTMLEIEVVIPGEYDVILYDVTGRETARVFSGRIERSARVALNASEYASGVYFVKLARGNELFAVEKVLFVK